ncbi:hypothetical protein DNF11_0066 [Malassezia restricta CBS 7877]|uniref:Dolichyl-diphosphooligosaccharide-protein glycosyltransferase subunit OST5 n=1 Tax=Malassezia restricta (strain ATCC 96810 / NBRC 103918 / CBS 7877) TaxID=425264 RepID=A0A3G2RZP5_MALR7|nr:hypothetical protein DNF11_0066 [Malassezia restricta CBS 7877]
MSQLYAQAEAEYNAWPVQNPLIPVRFLPAIASVSLGAAFLLAFFYTTLPNTSGSIKAPVLSLLSSLCAGVGLVALMNAVGVYV